MKHYLKIKRVVSLIILIIFFLNAKGQSTIENTINEDYWYVSKCGNSSYRKIASPFTTPSGRIKVTKIEVNSYDNNSNFLAYARIETSSSGSPSNTVVTNGTSNSVACTPAGWVAMTYTSGSQPILSANTTYFVVLSGASGSTATSCQFRTNDDLGNISKWSTTTNCGSETWAACGSYGDLLYKIYYEFADPTSPTLSSTGSSSQITFNNSYINDNTPLFRISSTYSSTINRFQIEVNSASDFSGTSYKQTFSGTYTSGTAYDLECTSLDNSWSPTNGTTYYVRVRASADGGSNYGPWSAGTYSFTYKTSGDVEWYQKESAQIQSGTVVAIGANKYGNTSVQESGSSTYLATGEMMWYRAYVTKDEYLQSVSVRLKYGGAGYGNVQMAVYDGSGNKIAETNSTACVAGTNTLNTTSNPLLSANTYYYIAVMLDDTDQRFWTASTEGESWGRYTTGNTYGVFPNTLATGTTWNNKFEVFLSTAGTIISTAIQFASFNGASAYESLAFSTSGAGTVSVGVYADATASTQIIAPTTSSPLVLTGINTTTYPTLYLKAIRIGTSPSLDNWKVTANYGSSNESDIVEAGFDEPDNISYKDYQAASSLTTSNSIKIGSFTIRDGGSDLSDADSNPTNLTDISFSVSNSSNIRVLAIFDGATNLKEVTTVSATTTFSSISGLSASDNSSKTFDVYATFKTTVTDNQQIQLAVSSVTSGSSSSLFAAGNAGGASTSVAGDDNRIEVTATKLSITTEPSSSVCPNTNLSTAPIFATRDANDNTDLDFTGTVGLTNAGSIGMTGNSVAASAGVVTFTNLQFTIGGVAGALTTTNSEALTNATSATSISVTAALAAPSISSHSQTTTSLTWNWGTVSGASSYQTSYDGGSWTSNGTSTTYNQTSLGVNTQHRLNINTINSCGNSSAETGDTYFYTSANVPAIPTIAVVSYSSLSVNVNVNSNPASTEFAIYCNTTSNYVQADGTLGASAIWQTDAVWGTINVTGLTPNTTYTFKVKARNGDGDETAFSGNGSGTTPCAPAAIPFFEGFESGFSNDVSIGGCYSQQDVDDGNAGDWYTYNDGSPYAHSGTWEAALYHGHTDDWLFIPVALTGGLNYSFSMYAYQESSTASYGKITVKYGTTNTAAGMTSGTIVNETNIGTSYQQLTGTISPSSTGTYYIGIKGYVHADVYYYLYIDDISIDVILDQDSKAEEPASQISATSISSVSNDSEVEAMEVFKFKITDLSTTDSEPTKVTNIRIKPGSSNTADWSNSIQGVKLHNGSGFVTIGSPTITDTYIDIPISSGNLNILDGSSQNMVLYAYLNTSNIVDGAILDFRIDYDDHGFTADASGSSFTTTFGSTDIEGNNITIDVAASKLTFSSNAPTAAVALNSNFVVTVNATDANGNIDNSGSGNVTLSIASGTGILSSSTGLTQTMSNGTVSWNDVNYDALANCSTTFLTILANHTTLTDATTSCIQVVGAPENFDFTASNSSGCAGNFTISWSASSGATSYDLYYCEGVNCNPIYSSTIITGVTSDYSFNAVNANSEYNFAVLAKNVASETWSSSYLKRTTWSGNTWVGTTSTNWSTASNWCGNVIPTSNDDIVISGGLTHYPILTANVSVNNITIQSGASLGLGTYTLNVFGNVDFSAGTLNAGTGTINMTAGNNSVNISNATTTVHNGDKFYDTGGPSGNYGSNENITNVLVPENYGDKVTLKFIANNFDGDRLIIYDNNGASGTVLYDGSATEASIIGTFTATNSTGALTVVFISGGFFQYSGWEAEISIENPLIRTIDVGSNDLYNLEVNGREVHINNNALDINGNLTINSGIFDANGQNIEIAGNWTNHAVFYPGIGTVTFDGSTDAIIEKDGPTVIVYSTGFEDSDGGTAGWYTGSIPSHTEWRRQSGDVAGNRIAPKGTYDMGAYNLHDNTPGYYYTTDASKNCYATLSKIIDLRDVVDAQLSFLWYYQGGGPVGTDSYNGMVSVDGIRFDNFLRWETEWNQEIYDISDFCNKEALLAFDMNLLYAGEAPDDPGKYGYAIDNVVVTGTSCAESFNHFKINKSGGASVSLSNTNPTRINVDGDVFIESGTFKAQDNRIRCKGNFTSNGVFISGNGDVVMNGSTNQSIKGSENITFYNLFKDSPADLIIGDAAVSGKTIEVTNEFSWTDNNDKIVVGDGTSVTFKIASNMTIYNGCTLETKDNTVVSIAGNYTDYGTLTPNKGMVKFFGNTNSYIIREPAEVLFIENFEDGNSDGWSFSGGSEDAEWIIHSGSSHNSTYDLATRGAGSYPVPYSYWADGSTATTTDAYISVDLTGYSNVELQFYWRLGGKFNVQYGQLLIDTDGYSAGAPPTLLMDTMYKQAQYTVSPRFDISQYANRVVTLIFRFISTGELGGGNPGFCIDDIMLTGTSVNLETFYDVSVDKSNNKSAVLRCPIDVDNDVTITNGDLNSGGISFPVGRNWSNLNSSTFTHQKNTIIFDGNYEGKNQIVTNNAINTFFNVIIDNATGTVKLASNRWYLDSNLTITSGTLITGTTSGVDDQDIYIHGHWKNIGGTFNPLSKTVYFRGVADQQLITNNSPFYNITLPTEKENALILNDKLTINNNLLLTNGILDVKTNIQDIDINGHWLNNGGTFLHPNNTTTKVTFGGNAIQLINKKSDALSSPPGTTNNLNFSFDNILINGTDVRFYVDSENGKLLNVRNLTINANKKFKLIDD